MGKVVDFKGQVVETQPIEKPALVNIRKLSAVAYHKGRTQGTMVYIGRPGPWGNPFPIQKDTPANRQEALAKYEAWAKQPAQKAFRNQARQNLQGKTLVCWCSPKACHGEILQRIVVSPREK